MNREDLVKISQQAILVATEAVERVSNIVKERSGGTISVAPEAEAMVIGPIATAMVAEALRESGRNVGDILIAKDGSVRNPDSE